MPENDWVDVNLDQDDWVDVSSANQRISIKSPFVAAVRGLAEGIPGTTFATQYYMKGGPFNPRSIQQARQVAEPIEQARTEGLLAKFGEAAGSIPPFLALSNPFIKGAAMLPRFVPPIAKSALGLGSYEASRQAIGRGNPIEGFGQGALSGALFHGGARVGATIFPKNHIGRRVGSGIGAGAVGASLAPEEDKIPQAAIGAAFGLARPGKSLFTGKTKGQYMGEAINEFRNILRPTQGEIKNIEIRKGKNINDYYKLAAEEQLPIKQSADKKLDTLEARENLKPRQSAIHEILNEQLKLNSAKQFELFEIGKKAKQELRQSIKNDTEYKDAIKDVDEYIIDAVNSRGRFLSGKELNNFKQGMWSVSYNMLKPIAQNTARKIGFIAKESIEDAYPSSSIKNLNDLSGKYSTLNILLQNAHGRVVSGGQLTRRFAEISGAIAGSKIPIAGPIAGRYLGGKAADFIAAPERASKIASRKARKGGIVGESFKRVINEASGEDPIRNINTPPTPTMISYKRPLALPAPRNMPYNPQGFPQNPKPLITPNEKGAGIINLGNKGSAFTGSSKPPLSQDPIYAAALLKVKNIEKLQVYQKQFMSTGRAAEANKIQNIIDTKYKLTPGEINTLETGPLPQGLGNKGSAFTGSKSEEPGIRSMFEKVGAKLKKITEQKDSFYADEPTIYFDVEIPGKGNATFNIRPSQLTPENIIKKISQSKEALTAIKSRQPPSGNNMLGMLGPTALTGAGLAAALRKITTERDKKKRMNINLKY